MSERERNGSGAGRSVSGGSHPTPSAVPATAAQGLAKDLARRLAPGWALGLAPCLALASLATPLEGQEVGSESILEVTGTGRVSVPVDQASMLLAVETEAVEAQRAVAENTLLMERVIAAVRSAGVDGTQLETVGFNLQPVYGRPAPGQTARVIEHYKAVNNLSVTVDDVEAVGMLLDAAVSAGANRVASLNFRARDVEAARAQALAEAVRQARAEAEVIAEALGQTLGVALEVRGGALQPMARSTNMAFESAVAAVPVESGDQTVTATVSIKYRLGGDRDRP